MSTGIAIAGLLVSTLLGAPAAVSPAGPPPGKVTIDKLKVNGTGCRSETTTIAVSPDNEAFTVTYNAYTALSGAGAAAKDGRKACSITVRLNVPQRVTYAVTTVVHRGFAHLEPGATAELATRYHFQGAGAPAYTRHGFAAQGSDSWQVTDAVPASAAVFGACGKDRKLDIDTQLGVRSVDADPATSVLTMDTSDGEFATTYRLAYRRCD